MHTGRRAGVIGELVRAGTRDKKDPAIGAHKFLDRERRAGAAAIRNRLDTITEPFACERACKVRLVLMVGLQNLDRFAIDLVAELFGRHSRRFDRSGSHGSCKNAIHVGKDADADGIALDFGPRRRTGENKSD